QKRIHVARNEAQVGTRAEVLIDGLGPDGVTWLGRTFADAPEVDGTVRVRAEGLKPGDFVEVQIEGCDEYDLDARLLEPVNPGGAR
ncbi:MAG: hypothetical protein RL562_1304, partial [Planctomycetota bacterium]